MKSITNLINPQILGKASQLARLNSLIRSCLPIECQPHIFTANIRDHQLILVTDSPVWSSRIRLYQNNILDMLKSHTELQISQIIIKQTYHQQPVKTEHNAKRFLSDSSARVLTQTAEAIDDIDLQQALIKLVKKTSRKT